MPNESAAAAAPGERLDFADVTVRFGGVTALNGVSFTVLPGTIHALIGPNGAGKSTCFNVISGFYRAAEGTVRFAGQDITRTAPHDLTRLGIGRAFQNVALSPSSSVLDNVMLGRHALTRGGFLAAGLRLRRVAREQARHRARAIELCELFGLGPVIARPVAELSYGDAKRVDIVRALATEPRLLMLDEPVAGMNAAETDEMAQFITDIRAALDLSVLLVEHDMGLVMGIADRVTVLDFGSRIADGTPAEIQADPEVIRAYLGADESDVHDPARPDVGSLPARDVFEGSL